ncbi:heterogeneous nuclear ribonucleoprotein R [Sarotherodon galilaeus]
MPPKKGTVSDDEMEEIKKSLNYMSGELSTISKQQKLLLDMMGQIKGLQKLNEEKDKKIALLESRVADLEQYTRMNDLIVSGLETKHRTYARAVVAEEGREPTEADIDSLEQQILNFFSGKGITINSKDIEACHPLPRKNNSGKPSIIIRFVNRKSKKELLRQAKKLRGTNVYINEHLTKKNADIARQARILRRQNKIQSTWTANCKVYIKLKGTPEEQKVVVIKELSELDKY